MKSRYMFFSFLILVMLVAACAPAATSTVAAKESIKIAALHNMTGNEGPLDGPASQGAKLAMKQINAKGGLLGGRMIDLRLLDTKTDIATAGNAATQLVNEKVVAAEGFADTDYALAVGPIFAKAGISYTTAGATSPKLTDVVPDWLFMANWGDNTQAAAMAEYAVNKLNLHTAYIMNNAGKEVSYLVTGYFQTRFQELGGKVLLVDNYQTGDKDYSAEITKFKSLNPTPDLIYVGTSPDDIGTIIKQFREAGVTAYILSHDGADTPLLLQVAGANAVNVFYTTHAFFEENTGTDAVKKFMADYKAEYGNIPENAFVGLAYDAVNLIADAITRAGSTDPTAIKDALKVTKDFPAVTGNITFVPPLRIPNKLVYIIGAKDGKFFLADTVIPEKVPAP